MKKFLISSIIFSIVVLTACAPAAPIATATSVPSETPSPISTPTNEPTLAPTATAPATETPMPTQETYAPMKLETDPQKSDILKWEDVESGRLLYNLKKLNVQFPSGLTIDKVGKLNGELFIAGDKDSVKLVATMPIDTTFLTTTDKAPNGEKPYVAILAISNPDNTIGFLSVMLNNADELSLFTKMLQSNGTNDLVFFIQKSTTLDIKNKNDAKWWPSFRLYETENRLKMSKGELQIVTVLNDVLSTGKFGDETSRIIVSATVVK